MTKIIVIEGGDGTGKQTQALMLVAHLRSLGYKVAHVEAPINDIITYNPIYWMLENGAASKFPRQFQFLQFLNKKLFQVFRLPWLEFKNDFIVFDRWGLSAIIYGNAIGLDHNHNNQLYEKLRKPNMTIVLNGSALTDEFDDVYESNSYLQTKVKNGYIEWANSHNDAILINNIGTRSHIHSQIVDAIKNLL
jgi:thymidylate kinase